MSQINFEITLYSSPFYEDSIGELYRITRYKKNIYKKVRTEEEFRKKLSYDERKILDDLTKKENKIFLEILTNKNWLELPHEFIELISNRLNKKSGND